MPLLGSSTMGNAIHPASGAGNPCILVSVPVTSSLPRISSSALLLASSPFRFLLGAPGFLQHLPQTSPLQTPLWATTLCQTLLPTPGSTFLLPAISPLIIHCLVFFAAWPSLVPRRGVVCRVFWRRETTLQQWSLVCVFRKCLRVVVLGEECWE